VEAYLKNVMFFAAEVVERGVWIASVPVALLLAQLLEGLA
jgi:hypothetical protein